MIRRLPIGTTYLLALASLVCVVDFAASTQYHDQSVSKTIKLNDLMKHLDKLRCPTGIKASKVVHVLAQVDDKESKTILDKYSVNDLLEWNDFKLSNCMEDILFKREKECDALNGIEVLGPYCFIMTIQHSGWCNKNREQLAGYVLSANGFSEPMAVKALAFGEEYAARLRKYKNMIGYHPHDKEYKSVVKELMDEQTMVGRKNLALTCEALVGILSKMKRVQKLQYEEMDYRRKGWYTIYRMCAYLNDVNSAATSS